MSFVRVMTCQIHVFINKHSLNLINEITDFT